MSRNYQFLGGAPRLTLDQVAPKEFAQVKAGLKDAVNYRLYDSLLIDGAAAAVSANPQRLFQVGVGQSASTMVAGTAYTKTLQHTNMTQAGQLPAGQTFLVNSIQAVVIQTGAWIASQTAPSGDDATASTVEGDWGLKAILQSGILTLTIGDKDYEQAPLLMFPSKYGISGFAATATTATTVTNTIAALNNGFGNPYQCLIPHRIDSSRHFEVKIQFPGATVISNKYFIQVVLEGVLFRSVQ